MRILGMLSPNLASIFDYIRLPLLELVTFFAGF